MGLVNINGNDYPIYGEQATDDPGPPVIPSADTYFGGLLNTEAWDNADGDTQAKALVTSSRVFDKQFWVGAETDPGNQPLAWPRTGVNDCEGNPVPDDEIPLDVIYGSYEYALALLQDAELQNEASAGSNVKRTESTDKVGDLETTRNMTYFGPTNIPGSRTAAGRFPPQVQEYIRCFIDGKGGSGVCITGTKAPIFPDDFTFNDIGIP